MSVIVVDQSNVTNTHRDISQIRYLMLKTNQSNTVTYLTSSKPRIVHYWLESQSCSSYSRVVEVSPIVIFTLCCRGVATV